MKYGLNLAADGRVLSATFAVYAPADAPLVEQIPEDDITNYIYVEGKLQHFPAEKELVEEKPDRLDVLEAQITYTAMMTDTLLEG